MEFPELQIRQTYAKVGIDADLGQYRMYTPEPQLQITKSSSQLDIQRQPSQLRIDSSRAWAALGVGDHMEWSNNIYSQMKNVVLQGILRRIEDGNRMLSSMAEKKDPIPDLAEKNSKLENSVEYTTSAGFDQVAIDYRPAQISIQYEPERMKMDWLVSRPEIEYQRGKLDIYLLQKPSITITPPALDRLV